MTRSPLLTMSPRTSIALIHHLPDLTVNYCSYQLAAVNPTIDDLCHNLQIDQVLCLGTEGEDCTNTHIVAENDSCEFISSTYGLNSTVLFHNNPQIDAECSNIYTGEVR